MAGFVAQGVVEPLDYDFNPYVNTKGTIPEPTDTQIAEFLRGIKTVIKDTQKDLPDKVNLDDPVAVLAAIDDLDPAAQVEAMNKMAEVYSALCSNTPTSGQLMKLPMRVRQIFFAWLQGEVLAPEAATGGGPAQVTHLHGARAG